MNVLSLCLKREIWKPLSFLYWYVITSIIGGQSWWRKASVLSSYTLSISAIAYWLFFFALHRIIYSGYSLSKDSLFIIISSLVRAVIHWLFHLSPRAIKQTYLILQSHFQSEKKGPSESRYSSQNLHKIGSIFLPSNYPWSETISKASQFTRSISSRCSRFLLSSTIANLFFPSL